MKAEPFKIVGLGELLWDLLPAGKQLGGAPANFAYITTLLGNEGIAASCVGSDDLGDEAIRRLTQLGVSTTFIQRDTNHPTGKVNVKVDSTGQPSFEICAPVAWDFLEWTAQWQKLAEQADAVCFGSLAQRSAVSRSTIGCFLDATPAQALRVFDVNLRQNFYSKEILSNSMQRARIAKLNHEEVPRIMQLFGLEHLDNESSAQRLLSLYSLELVCVTRGQAGSLLVLERAIGVIEEVVGERQRDTGNRRRHAGDHEIADLGDRAQPIAADDGPPEEEGPYQEDRLGGLAEHEIPGREIDHRRQL